MSGEGLIAEPRAMHWSSVGTTRLAELMKRGTDFLGCDVAILCGAMSWVSERNLVSAISNAGGFGVIACGAMTPELLDREIAATKLLTAKPFGVNLITMHPMLSELIDVCANHRVTHVVLAGGLPPGGAIDRIKASGAQLIAFAPALSLAKKLRRSGADALVIEGMEAGGHIGPVSTSVLAQEILPEIAADVPVFVAGGIGRGEAIAAYLDMGAVGVQLGTRFVCATESIAHANFKKAFLRRSPADPDFDAPLPGSTGRLTWMDDDGQRHTTEELANRSNYLMLFEDVYQTLRYDQPYPVSADEILWQSELLELEAEAC